MSTIHYGLSHAKDEDTLYGAAKHLVNANTGASVVTFMLKSKIGSGNSKSEMSRQKAEKILASVQIDNT